MEMERLLAGIAILFAIYHAIKLRAEPSDGDETEAD